ncbi:MAG TPA: tetratricopeptide repeat protein [Candidatus Sulfotelmatobacter sp.]|nr:tetratricopeptide repeat protein [Candidatus Sulfotelmatobacter sp.]
MRARTLCVICFLLGCIAADGQTVTTGLDAPQLFEKGMNALMGSSVTRSDLNAIEYFHRSAELGFAPAQVVLGYLFETGRATPRNAREALEWYKKAAQQDDPLAQWLAGRIIYAGSIPGRDLNDAGAFLQSAADHGDAFGEYLLGKIKLERQDYPNAAAWLSKAAQQGLPQAQEQLAKLLRDGQGVAQDKFEAYVWMLVSNDAGNRSIASDLQALEAELGTNQVEQAKTKAREMERSVTRSVSAHGCTGWPGEFDAIPAPPSPDLQRFCR